jgi:N-acetylmuramoyl-L-alanine amidase
MNQAWTRRHLLVTSAALLAAGCSGRGGGQPAQGQSRGTWYVVQVGDTLPSLSQRSGLTSQAIIAANQLDSQALVPGRSLWLPGVARVAAGPAVAAEEPVAEVPETIPAPQGEPEPPPRDLPDAPATGYVLVPRSAWTKVPVGSRNQPMGGVQRLTIHHTDEHSGMAGLADVEIIRRIENYHRNDARHKWCAIGYHYIVGKDGRVYEGRPARYQGAHVRSENENNLGISVIGNFSSQLPSTRQLSALRSFLDDSREKYHVAKRNVFGHRDLNKSECPGDALYAWLKTRYKA